MMKYNNNSSENLNFFQGLPEKEMKCIEANTYMKSVKKREYIYFSEDPSNIIYFLKEGRVKIGMYSADGKEVIKAIHHPGEIFGELCLGGEEKRNDFAQAMNKDVRLGMMSLLNMEAMMAMNPNLSFKIRRWMGFRLRIMERKFESLVFKNTRTRLIDFIKDLAENNGMKIGDEIYIKHNLTHQDIGNLTSVSRQTATTILNDLEQNKLIKLERNAMRIRDINNLK